MILLPVQTRVQHYFADFVREFFVQNVALDLRHVCGCARVHVCLGMSVPRALGARGSMCLFESDLLRSEHACVWSDSGLLRSVHAYVWPERVTCYAVNTPACGL